MKFLRPSRLLSPALLAGAAIAGATPAIGAAGPPASPTDSVKAATGLRASPRAADGIVTINPSLPTSPALPGIAPARSGRPSAYYLSARDHSSSYASPAPKSAGPSLPRPASPAGGVNGFTYGYCTWWVAHRRPVPWRGNAWEWWGQAQAFGFAEGRVPRVGAIMVMGISASSPLGHVAYVESVGAGSTFVVSEMNWDYRWGAVDYRRITSLSGVIGFIY